MTLVLTSLALLGFGAAISLLLTRIPRLALSLSMLLCVVAAVLVVLVAVDVLLWPVVRNRCEIDWPLSLGMVRLRLDELSSWFLLTIGILGGCVAVYTVSYFGSVVDGAPVAVFCALFCGLLASLILLVCAGDAVLFLMSWEAMTLIAFLLVAFHHERSEVRRGAWMYLVAAHIGTALCLLPLFGYLFSRAGTTAMSSFAGALNTTCPTTLMILFALGLMGFGTKAGFMPMHVWLPAAHPVAPTPVSALLSGVVVKMGIYGLLRLLSWLPPLPLVCGEFLLLVGVVSGVMGVLYALAQHDLKRLLAYHTVENLGIIALGVAVAMIGETTNQPVLTVLGYAGALLHVFNHALFKGLLFLSAGAVVHDRGTADIDRLGGLARTTPTNAWMFLIGAFAICGLPPLNGFLSEWVIYGSLFGGSISGTGAWGGWPVVGLASLALMGGLALACFAKVFGVVFLGVQRDAGLRTRATPAGMKWAMGILGLLCVLIGVLPDLWVPMVQSATAALANVSVDEFSERMESVLAPAVRLTTMAVLLVVITGSLLALRRLTFSGTRPRDAGEASTVATWGCAYARPTPRMQYSASSFAHPLITTFRSLLWPDRSLVSPAGPFPTAAHLESQVPDIAEHDIFTPAFRGIARLFAMVRTVSWLGERVSPGAVPVPADRRRGPIGTLVTGVVAALRRGSIQIRLSFFVLTLVVVFLFEAVSSGNRAMIRAEQSSQRSVEPGAKR